MAKHHELPQGGGEDQSSGLRPSTGDSKETTREWNQTHPSGGHDLSKEPGQK